MLFIHTSHSFEILAKGCGKGIKLFYKQLKCFVFCQNMNGRKVKDVFVSCKCFSTFSEKPWLKLFEGHEMAFFYAAKVLFSLYEKKKSFLSETFFYTLRNGSSFLNFFCKFQ